MDYYPLPNFRRHISIIDMVLCELLCQAQVISDQEATQLIAKADNGRSFASTLCAHGFMTDSKVFSARRLAAKYLSESDNADKYICEVKALCFGSRASQAALQAQPSTAKITEAMLVA
jgi:hypothetical protein